MGKPIRRLGIGRASTREGITEPEKRGEKLYKIEWLLKKGLAPEHAKKRWHNQPYGNLVKLNTHRVVLDSVGENVLTRIVDDFLCMLETSAAVYEKNGDYALGIFASGWCRFLDQASRKLCNTKDNREALKCGKWHCHESCWTEASKLSVEISKAVDVECRGGIRLYAVPIWVRGKVVGSINFGYGDPPKDLEKLRQIAERYRISVNRLKMYSNAYDSRPPFMTDLAKSLLITKARLIGEIIEHKEAEEALKESEHRFRAIFKNAADGMLIADTEFKNFYDSNQAMCEMLGFSLDEIKALTVTNIHRKEDLPFILEQYEKLAREEIPEATDIPVRRKDGSIFYASIKGYPIKIGEKKYLIGIFRDITERMKTEEALKRDKETFERLVNERTQELLKVQAELNRAKRLSDLGALAATVAHELRNPLGVIKTASYNIRKKIQHGLIDKHLNNIEKKISESDLIINNLLSYSRIKLPSYEKVRIHDILEECITFARTRFHKQNVSIVKKIKSAEKRLIEADSLQIREIFNNILINAYQSISNKKGKIEIRVGLDGKDFIRITFKDNGIGIDKEDLQRVFEPFFTRKSKGTGLGLTICKELVNLYGGKIGIESKKGKGTTVTVSLPIRMKRE